ncbi:MAG: TetR/AcrR family transcriptional regulator [Spirochaetia bacterium]|nr:TetR/AcrR family transcriptional regulator [Spirochaetia bacterium]
MTTLNRKEEIIHAALNITAEKGTPNLTIAEIASKIGISDAAIYKHFKSKNDILMALIDLIGDGLTGILSDNTEKKPEERLVNILKKQLQLIEKNPGLPRLLFSDYVQVHDKALKEKMLKIIMSYINGIKAILKDGISQKYFRDDLNPNAAAYAFLGLIQSNIIVWSLSDFSFSLTKTHSDIWQVLLKGLK